MDELAPHLPLELDFRHEASNLRRCRDFFCPPSSSSDSDGAGGGSLAGRVVVPDVVDLLSSHRVLSMSFEHGVRLTDGKGIDELGIERGAVTRLLSEAFCSQIFLGGFVHCDPHPGNLLVRCHPNGRPGEPQLVLLDHGLYRDIPETFQLVYARLWRGLITGNADLIKAQARSLPWPGVPCPPPPCLDIPSPR